MQKIIRKNQTAKKMLTKIEENFLIHEFCLYCQDTNCIAIDYSKKINTLSSINILSPIEQVNQYLIYLKNKFLPVHFPTLSLSLQKTIQFSIFKFLNSYWFNPPSMALFLFLLEKQLLFSSERIVQTNSLDYLPHYQKPSNKTHFVLEEKDTILDYLLTNLYFDLINDYHGALVYQTVSHFEPTISQFLIKQQLFNPHLLVEYLSFFSSHKLNTLFKDFNTLSLPQYQNNDFKPIYLCQKFLNNAFQKITEYYSKKSKYHNFYSLTLKQLELFIIYLKEKDNNTIHRLTTHHSEFLMHFIENNELEEGSSHFLTILAQEKLFVLEKNKISPVSAVLEKCRYFNYFNEDPPPHYLILLEVLLQQKLYHPEDEKSFITSKKNNEKTFVSPVYSILEKHLLLKTHINTKEQDKELL